MRDKGIVSRGLTRPKAQKWINVETSQKEGWCWKSVQGRT